MSLRQLPSKHCECSPNGRNLVVCIDGTSNQFGAKNTNVIEIYSQLIKSGEQITYYNSGIGTYAKPSWSWNYVKQAVDNAIDLAIAWNFERTVMAAYRWLSDNYKEGDRIYLFGFSRGAYQVRALAGMIQKVGLIYRGNEEQIPFAYELYVDQNSDKFVPPQPTSWSQYFRLAPQPVQPEPIDLAQRFKSTFSRENVSVHFVGVWDTVSSVGIVRGKNLPLTDTVDHVCFFRHALALDERRVKFLPEYAIYEQDRRPAISKGLNRDPSAPPPPPHIKEVWFPGTHSDIGGGNQLNVNLDLGRTPGIWMMSEAIGSGALLRPKKVEWDWQNLDVVKESLTGIWYPFEWIPFKRLSYEDSTSTTYQLHFGEGRIIHPGQKIHTSVAFCKPNYRPKATLPDHPSLKDWSDLVHAGGRGRIDWAKRLEDILEMDIFDHEAAVNVVDKLTTNQGDDYELWLHHLDAMVWSYEGCSALMGVDKVIPKLIQVLPSGTPDAQSRLLGALYTCNQQDLFLSLPDEAFDILVSMICGEYTALVRGRAMKLLFKTKLDEVFKKKLLTESIFDTLAILLSDSNAEVVKEALEALTDLLRYLTLTKRIVVTDTASGLRPNLQLSVSVEVFRCLTLALQFDDTRKKLFDGDVISSIKEIISDSRSHYREYALDMLQRAINYDELRAEFLVPKILADVVTMLQDRSESLVDSAIEFLVLAAKIEIARNEIFSSSRISSLRTSPGDAQWPGDLTFIKLLGIALHFESLRKEIFDPAILTTLRQLLMSKDEKTKKAAVKLLVSCVSHDDVYPHLLDANAPDMLREIRTYNSWDVRKEYLNLLTVALDHDQLHEIIFTDDAIAYLQEKFDERPVMDLMKHAVKIDNIRTRFFDRGTVLRFRKSIGYRNEEQERNIRPILELALEYEEIRHRIFLDDELDLANKWTQSDDKPRREARWSLALAVRHEDLCARLFDPGVISTIKQLLVQNDRDDKKEDAIDMLSQIVECHDKLSDLFDHDTIKIIHGLLLDSPGDIKEKAVSFLEKAMKYERFRSALFDDALFQGLVTSFREGGPYKLGPLKVRILGIGIQYEEIRNKLLLSDLPARFQNVFVHPWQSVRVKGLKVLEIMTNYVELHPTFFDAHTIKVIEDATENDSWGESIDILKASLTCHELSLKLFTPAIIAKIPKILLDGGNLNIMIRNKTLYLLKDLVVHDGLRGVVFTPEIVMTIIRLVSEDTYTNAGHYSFEILENLARYGDYLDLIFDSKTLFFIPRALYSDQVSVRRKYLRLLRIATQYGKLRKRLFLSTVVSGIQKALVHADDAVRAEAANLVKSMNNDNDLWQALDPALICGLSHWVKEGNASLQAKILYPVTDDAIAPQSVSTSTHMGTDGPA